ncbi:CD1845 family protein [Allobaculum stercoricanis]|uniref:CD1845 family protein n=1 Tax=Allobaculum stercoricanis TaxID=174709 RepID=UPI000362AF40|nr:CD1845 family protein [Allobaculum stercoricanis]
MKFILKILFAPVIAILAVIIWLSALTLKLSAWVFGIVSTILGVLGLAVLLLDSFINGITILVFAFLVSPVGLPMVAAWTIGQMQRFRYFVQDAVYG